MELLLLDMVQKFPVLASVLMLIGALRVTIKPLMAYLEQRAAETEDTKDDERLAKIKANKVYKVLVFLLDYTASIKLPK